MNRLVGVGNVLVDLVVRGRLPERGSDSVATSGGLSAGGAFNALLAATRQGLPAAYAGGHGRGPFGDLIRSTLRDAGIDILQAPATDRDSGYDIAIVEDDGERTFLTVFGAEAELSRERLDDLRLKPEDAVLVSGYGLLDSTNGAVLPEWIASIPREHVVMLDPGPLVAEIRHDVWLAAAGRADWLSCNEREARLLTGENEAATAAGILATRFPGVIVRQGPNGCILATPRGLQQIPGFAVTAVDSNGAGDAHTGGFLAALAEGLEPRDAALRANACAAIAVTRRGPATAPTRAEALRLLEA